MASENRRKHILRLNGDIVIGEVVIGFGKDCNQGSRLQDIMCALLRRKWNHAQFMIRTNQEGPGFYLLEHEGKLMLVEMGLQQLTLYRDVMEMDQFVARFIGDLRRYCKHRVSLPDNIDRKNGKRIVKGLVDLLKLWKGQQLTMQCPRRGAARLKKMPNSKIGVRNVGR